MQVALTPIERRGFAVAQVYSPTAPRTCLARTAELAHSLLVVAPARIALMANLMAWAAVSVASIYRCKFARGSGSRW